MSSLDLCCPECQGWAAEEYEPRIAALEAELERLRCCGNCGRFVIDWDDLETYCPNGDGTFTRCYIQDSCHLTPSRWKEAER